MEDDDPLPDKIELDNTETGFVFPAPSESGKGDQPPPPQEPDFRLYIPDTQRWGIQVKRNSDNEYCYTANPGEDFFHLLLDGELYVERGYEKYCLNCAMRQGLITSDRLYWQRRGGKPLTS